MALKEFEREEIMKYNFDRLIIAKLLRTVLFSFTLFFQFTILNHCWRLSITVCNEFLTARTILRLPFNEFCLLTNSRVVISFFLFARIRIWWEMFLTTRCTCHGRPKAYAYLKFNITTIANLWLSLFAILHM